MLGRIDSVIEVVNHGPAAVVSGNQVKELECVARSAGDDAVRQMVYSTWRGCGTGGGLGACRTFQLSY